MNLNLNISICEICHKNRRKGDHSACSKEKQRRGSAAAKRHKAPTIRTYTNERLLTGFIKTIES